jgi:polyphosphate kinase
MAKAAKYVNRELSWLEFNQRVLDEATDESIPLLERLKFLAITGSNLDEFFMVRVGGLQILLRQGSGKRDHAGMTLAEQLAEISRRAHRMFADQYVCLLQELEPGLAQADFRRIAFAELTDQHGAVLEKAFDSAIFPVYTPMAVNSTEDFPLLINKTLNVCVRLAPATQQTEARYAVIPFGLFPDRFVPLPTDTGYRYVLLEDVVRLFISRYFPGEAVAEVVPFRITRNADMEVREDSAADLMSGMEEVLDARKESECVRLEVADIASPQLLEFLQRTLRVADTDVYKAPGPLDLSAFMWLTNLAGFPQLKYDDWPPQPSPDVDPTHSMFDEIHRKDILLYLPYESFEPVVRWIEEAASDPQVLAIKIILYRTSRNSTIVAALRRAAEQGKHVTALVELKARFDEARNIEWARALEQAGVQVIYGVKGLKTHAKVCVVIRREPLGIQRYVHFSTGNYNEVTARLYSDASLLTTNEDLAADATSFFNAISGYSQPQLYRKIAAAPISLRDRLLELIEAEIDRKREGQEARIMAQLNSLADAKIINALYRASKAGIRIDLNVRGICCLRPGVDGLSENIRVVSILDRYLEHSRIIYFYHGGDELVFISSADWMPRNLDRRIELLVPVEDPPSRRRLIAILHSYARDNVKVREMQADGQYVRQPPPKGKERRRHQQEQYRLACEAEKKAEQSRRTVFEPHRAAGKGE